MKYFNNTKDFIEWFMSLSTKSDDNTQTDLEYVLWFVCLQEARMMADRYTTKDLANLILNGIEPATADPIETIEEWWFGIFEALTEDRDETPLVNGQEISDEMCEMYGIPNVIQLMMDDGFIN